MQPAYPDFLCLIKPSGCFGNVCLYRLGCCSISVYNVWDVGCSYTVGASLRKRESWGRNVWACPPPTVPWCPGGTHSSCFHAAFFLDCMRISLARGALWPFMSFLCTPWESVRMKIELECTAAKATAAFSVVSVSSSHSEMLSTT